MVRRHILGVVWFVAALCTNAQADGAHARWGLGVRGSWGWFSPHHSSMWYLVERHAFMGEVFYQRPFSGRRQWHHDRGAPEWGIGLMGTDAGSPHHIGWVARALPYLVLPIGRARDLGLHARVGWGLAWIAEPYDREVNHRQVAIGSHINAAVLLAIELQKRVGRDRFGLGIALDHQSNGSLQVPNLGINLVSVGLSWNMGVGSDHALEAATDTVSDEVGAWRTEVMAAWGYQEIEPIGSGKRTVIAVSATMYRQTSPVFAWGGGADVFNKGSLRDRDPELANVPLTDLTQAGLHIGVAYCIGGLALVLEPGCYVITPVEERSRLYQRIGMRQRIGKHVFANLTLKTHFGAADHFELGLGYRW